MDAEKRRRTADYLRAGQAPMVFHLALLAILSVKTALSVLEL